MPVNLYHTDDYLVIHAGLPRCLPDRVHVFVAPGKMLIQAERHPGEPIREERAYILSELPDGVIGRDARLAPRRLGVRRRRGPLHQWSTHRLHCHAGARRISASDARGLVGQLVCM